MLFSLSIALASFLGTQDAKPEVPRREPLAKRQALSDAELERLTKAERDVARPRRARIREELKQAGLPRWAGEYGASRGSLSFAVAPSSGMTACKEVDVVGTDRWNDGAVVASGERWIDVEFVLPHEALFRYDGERRVACVARRFYLTTWRDWDFLVPEHRMLAFCNVFNSMDDSRRRSKLFASFASKANGGAVEATSSEAERLPDVPTEFRKYLLDRVVTGKVLFVAAPVHDADFAEEAARFETIVTVDVGRKDRLLPGMLLSLAEIDGYGEGEILDTEESTARVAFRHPNVDGSNHQPIVKDAPVTTRKERARR